MSDYKAGLSPIEYKTVQNKWLERATERLKELQPVTIDHPNLGKVQLTIDSLEPFFNNDACNLQESEFTKRIYATSTPMTFGMNKLNKTFLFWQRLHESPDAVLSAIKLDGKSIYDRLAEKGLYYHKATYARLSLTIDLYPKYARGFGYLNREKVELGHVTTEQYYKSTVSDPLDIIAQYNKQKSANAMFKAIKKHNKIAEHRLLSTYSKFVITDGKVYNKTIQKPENIITTEEYRDMCDLDHQIYLWWLDIENVVFRTAAGLINQANDMGVRLINPDSEWFTFDQL